MRFICARDLTKCNAKGKRLFELIEAEFKRRTTAKSTLQAMCCCFCNEVFRRRRTWWQWCSGTDNLCSQSETTLEFELSLWLKDQRQRTVQWANVNHVSNAELQKARNMMTIIFVKRRSKITSKTVLNSRTVHHWQVYEQEASLCCQSQWQKDLEK